MEENSLFTGEKDSLNALSNSWCGLDWSPFVTFNFDRSDKKDQSNGPGFYRVKVSSESKLAYIGQTGRNLEERVRALIRNTLADEMPFNDPHTAAPRLWSYRQETGMRFEVSTASYNSIKQQRLCMESYLIWSYRRHKEESPLCNFGRLHPNYLSSRNRSTGVRGKRIGHLQVNPSNAPSVRALDIISEPTKEDWMGVNWSKPVPLEKVNLKSVPDITGVYRMLVSQLPVYYGEASNLNSRLKNHSRKWSPLTHFSHAAFKDYNKKCQRLEIENDLIAGHFSFYNKPPENQFGSHTH